MGYVSSKGSYDASKYLSILEGMGVWVCVLEGASGDGDRMVTTSSAVEDCASGWRRREDVASAASGEWRLVRGVECLEFLEDPPFDRDGDRE